MSINLEGRYYGIPVKVKLIDDFTVEIIGKNRFYDWLIVPMTWFENGLNFICSLVSKDYEPHVRVKVKEDI